MRSQRQRGFSIIAAIFLVVVIALIAGFLVTVGSVQRTTSAYSIIASRAHFAAISGIEWGVHQVLANPAMPACFDAGGDAEEIFTVPGAGSGNFLVTVTCSPAPNGQQVFEGARQYSVFEIDVVAEFGTSGSEDYFRRELSASVSSEL